MNKIGQDQKHKEKKQNQINADNESKWPAELGKDLFGNGYDFYGEIDKKVKNRCIKI